MTGAGGAAARGIAPAPAAADVGVVAALGIEVGFLTDRLKKVRKYSGPHHKVIEGEAGGKLIALVVGGAGRPAARRATGLLIDGHRPRWVLSAGFAGALDPALNRNAIVSPAEVLDPDGQAVPLGESPSHPADVTPRRLLTVDAIVRTAAEKATLRERFGADLVDMETAAVAAVCRERSVPCLSVRVVSDEAGADLPREVVTLMTRSGSYLVGSTLRALWNRPSALKDFWALHEHAQEAADTLADAVLAAIARLPA